MTFTLASERIFVTGGFLLCFVILFYVYMHTLCRSSSRAGFVILVSQMSDYIVDLKAFISSCLQEFMSSHAWYRTDSLPFKLPLSFIVFHQSDFSTSFPGSYLPFKVPPGAKPPGITSASLTVPHTCPLSYHWHKNTRDPSRRDFCSATDVYF